MAIGIIELHGQVTRAQDYTMLKQNEDNRPVLEQANLGEQMTRQLERKAEEVNQTDKAEYYNRKFDAKDKGDNSYAGDGGRKRKKDGHGREDGRVTLKGEGSHFDVSL